MSWSIAKSHQNCGVVYQKQYSMAGTIITPHSIFGVLLPTHALHICFNDDVIQWKHFPRYWPFVRGIHRWQAKSPLKGQWRRALIFFYDLRVNKRLSKQSWGWWFETTSSSLWRHCNVRDQFPHFWCVQCISWAIWIEMCFPVRPRVRLYMTVDYCHLNRTNIPMKLGCNISSVVTLQSSPTKAKRRGFDCDVTLPKVVHLCLIRVPLKSKSVVKPICWYPVVNTR